MHKLSHKVFTQAYWTPDQMQAIDKIITDYLKQRAEWLKGNLNSRPEANNLCIRKSTLAQDIDLAFELKPKEEKIEIPEKIKEKQAYHYTEVISKLNEIIDYLATLK